MRMGNAYRNADGSSTPTRCVWCNLSYMTRCVHLIPRDAHGERVPHCGWLLHTYAMRMVQPQAIPRDASILSRAMRMGNAYRYADGFFPHLRYAYGAKGITRRAMRSISHLRNAHNATSRCYTTARCVGYLLAPFATARCPEIFLPRSRGNP
ncbi:hypothetical protein K438DRAFT_1977747 [Mycena galopus ATCC 62051]|nr:hypothetical protein K438DRAFT_1977747 [Mycena galopus ATCC 62051]